eukprot:TRINITY_DN15124_c0_g1_i1.p1 TRINITY_DN15124_c0_g1~~TRINITY_DN15124_c0_g1_i1.p1  ORF type:complete len:383 (+),score=91.40 TRINITY_DN15124_c0_g1_i1:66-1151(+)
MKYLIEHNVVPGRSVWLEKSGEIIPKVTGIADDDSKPITDLSTVFPQNINSKGEFLCPCNRKSVLSQPAGKVDYFCVDPGCVNQVERCLVHFCSEKSMDIPGVGPSIAHDLVENEIIKEPVDILFLNTPQTIDKLKTLPSWGPQKISVLLKEIKSSIAKKGNIVRVLVSLGIPGIGVRASSDLLSHFKSLDKLAKASVDELKEVERIGENTANSIYNFWRNGNGVQIVEKMKKAGVQIEEDNTTQTQTQSTTQQSSNTTTQTSTQTSTPVVNPKLNNQNLHDLLNGKKVVISGVYKSGLLGDRDSVTQLVQQYGARILSGVTKSMDLLLIGEDAGPVKIRKATELGKRIIRIKELESIAKI